MSLDDSFSHFAWNQNSQLEHNTLFELQFNLHFPQGFRTILNVTLIYRNILIEITIGCESKVKYINIYIL